MATHVNGHPTPVREIGQRVYRWSFPGSPIAVNIDLGVVDRIGLQISGPHPQSAGILLGRVQGGVVQVHSARALATLEASAVEAALKDAAASGNIVVGYYRTDAGQMLRLSAEDNQLARRFFPPPSSVILLIHSGETGTPTAALFFWDDGQLFGEFALLEFPFDSAVLAAEQPQQDAPAAVTGAVDPSPVKAVKPVKTVKPVGDRVALKLPAISPQALRIGAWSGAALLLAGVSTAVVWRMPKWNLLRAPTQGSASLPRPKINLRAERSGQDFRLTWDRTSPTVTSAVSGVLSIQDARGRKEIPLGANQLLSGNILYQPYGDQIQLQLSLVSADQGVTSESVMVVLPPSGAPVMNVVSPARVTVAPRVPSAAARSAEPERNGTSTAAIESTADRAATLEKRPPAEGTPAPAPSPSTFNPPLRAAANPPPLEAAPLLEAPPLQSLPVHSPAILSLPAAIELPPPPQSRPTPAVFNHPAPARTLNYTGPVVVSRVIPHRDAAILAVLANAVEVEVKLQIDAQGRVVSAVPTQSLKGLNQHLERAAVDAALQWKFSPARINDKPVGSVQNLKFVFRK